ncbi:MAG: GNAT family N-acetyltransferase [Chloroflexaceae bacterium]|nr:GNAT family N-acetyltransferase [Chloroflexaceae bacterium]
MNMHVTVRQLTADDADLLGYLLAHEADFDLEDRQQTHYTIDQPAVRRFVTNPATLCWVAFADAKPIGSLHCIRLPVLTSNGEELLLYDIGVHHVWRRQGAGRALLAAMEDWMQRHGVTEVWVLADNPAAVAFYRACGFGVDQSQPVYLTRCLAD